jgi:hypothetical protein
MKTLKIIALGLLIFTFSCKTKQVGLQNTQTTDVKTSDPKTLGKVSHEFKATGCGTIVIIKDKENQTILIPKDALPEEFDKDGLQIYFEYRLLKMKNPSGCGKGIPADLSNISKK